MRLYAAILLILLCNGCAHDVTIGEKYVGKPYMNNPLGEDIAPDTDPLIRFDAFDCTTFVETALADGNVEKLNKIRYKNGKVGFINRNHIMETDWLPNNSELLTDVTRYYGKTSVHSVKIDRAKWMKCKHQIDDNTPVKTVYLEYIPYNNITKIENTEPLVVLFIRDKRIKPGKGTDLAVTHMGFLLPNGILRHASRRAKRVVDTDFYEYINRMVENQNNLGIMLLGIQK